MTNGSLVSQFDESCRELNATSHDAAPRRDDAMVRVGVSRSSHSALMPPSCWDNPLDLVADGGTVLNMVLGGTDKMMAQMRRGAIEYCVLALLRDQDRYGLELTRALADADGLVTSEGTVYPLLTRLREEGLVKPPGKNLDRDHLAAITA